MQHQSQYGSKTECYVAHSTGCLLCCPAALTPPGSWALQPALCQWMQLPPTLWQLAAAAMHPVQKQAQQGSWLGAVAAATAGEAAGSLLRSRMQRQWSHTGAWVCISGSSSQRLLLRHGMAGTACVGTRHSPSTTISCCSGCSKRWGGLDDAVLHAAKWFAFLVPAAAPAMWSMWVMFCTKRYITEAEGYVGCV